MILETLLGGLFGAGGRLVQHGIDVYDKAQDRKHEIEMLKATAEIDKQKGDQQIALANVEADKATNVAEITALTEAVKAQAQPTGIRFVDGLNALVRPILTLYWAGFLYSCVLGARGYLLYHAHNQELALTIELLWGPREDAIVSAMIGFFFINRSIEKNGK